MLIAIFFLPIDLGFSQIRGFTREGAAREQEVENKLKAIPRADLADRHMRIMSEEANHAGSPGSRRNALYVRDRFQEVGLETEIVEYDVLLPYPAKREIRMVEPYEFALRLQEQGVLEDKDSFDSSVLPPYNAYSASGNVTGQVVYVNYGMPADYEKLKELGISVEGRIVLARYGGGWRGLKPKLAAEHGAIGCLIYSDPQQDGYFRGDVYPNGPWRNATSVQRGSTMDMPTYPGDPLTPGTGATKNARRLSLQEATTLQKIPVQPISYADAEPLLKALGGLVAPEEWRGSLPLTYHLGPGPAKVRLHLELDNSVRTIYNAVGRFAGSEFPDEYILAGSHRDGWTYGASDPLSSMVSVLEVARAFGELVKQGFRPRRTVLFASWDAEEFGLIGSTEYGEQFRDELKRKAIVYINRDGNSRGVFSAGGVHSLEPFMRDVVRSVSDPDTGRPAYDIWREHQIKERKLTGDEAAKFEPKISALGSGSDYSVFLDHLGVSSLNFGFSGNETEGSYHSLFDNYSNYSRFLDPGFRYNVAASQVLGISILRLANAAILPFDFSQYANTIKEYLNEIAKLPDASRVQLKDLETRIDNLTRKGDELNKKVDALLARGEDAVRQNAAAVAKFNAALVQAERDLTDERGLPRRPWYKHLVYAPGYFTGYGVKTLPGVREAVEEKKWDEAAEQARRLGEALDRVHRILDSAIRTLP